MKVKKSHAITIPSLEMTSREIAELTGKEHKNVLADIEAVFNRLKNQPIENSTDPKIGLSENRTGGISPVVKEPTDTAVSDDSPTSLGVVTKSEFKDSRNRKQPMYVLDKKAAFVLVSGYSAVLRAACFDYIEKLEQEITRLKELKKNEIDTRQLAAKMYRPMTEALAEHRADLGKETKTVHYITEANMINRIVFGMDAKTWRECNPEQAEVGNVRDFATVGQKELITKLERLNTSYLDSNFDFETRKGMLQSYVNRKIKKLIEG